MESAEDRQRIRLRSCSNDHAGDWLKVIPNRQFGLACGGALYRIMLSFWLGLPVFDDVVVCPRCREQNLDVYGFHAVVCSTGNWRIGRHDRIRDVVFDGLQKALFNPTREVQKLLPGVDERPADIFVPSWSLGRSAAFDVTVVFPLQSHFLSRAAENINVAAEAGITLKDKKSLDKCAEVGLEFIALAMDTYGAFAHQTFLALSRIAFLGADSRIESKKVAARHFFQNIAWSLQVSNANMILDKRLSH